MSLIDLLLLLVIAAIIGFIAERLVGYSAGGILITIVLGFVGAVLGTWLAGLLSLPELFQLNVGGITIPVVWAIIGAVLFLAIVSLISRGGGFRWNVTPPTRLILTLAMVLAVLSLLSNYGRLSLPISAYILMALAFLFLLLGNLVRGL